MEKIYKVSGTGRGLEDVLRCFFLNESIDNEKDVEKAFSYIIDDDKKSMCDELKKVWKRVKNVICKEENCEKSYIRC